jgi:hypothetical protein
MTACWSSGFGKFSVSLMTSGLKLLRPNILGMVVSLIPKQKGVLSFGRASIKSNTYSNGVPFLELEMGTSAGFGKIAGFKMCL